MGNGRYRDGVKGIYNASMRVTPSSPDAFWITLSLSGDSQSVGGSSASVPVELVSSCDRRYQIQQSVVANLSHTVP
jgi:hypothetical protein